MPFPGISDDGGDAGARDDRRQAGLAAALREQWPTLAIQRCTTHKLRNLEAKAPAQLREELTEDYRRMMYADSRLLVYQVRAGFTKKWRLRCPAVIECLEEAGNSLSPSCASRRRNGRPRARRTGWNGSTASSGAAPKRKRVCPATGSGPALLLGLLRSGQVQLRKIDGWDEMAGMEAA